jgi:hypothetical protein
MTLRQPSGFFSDVAPRWRPVGTREVALLEQEVERGKGAGQSVIELVFSSQAEWDVGLDELAAGSNDALRDGRF